MNMPHPELQVGDRVAEIDRHTPIRSGEIAAFFYTPRKPYREPVLLAVILMDEMATLTEESNPEGDSYSAIYTVFNPEYLEKI